jgi:hypothetical protein
MNSRISTNPRRAWRRSRLAVAAGTIAVTAAAAVAFTASAAAPQAGQRIDMKVLLLATDGTDGNMAAWEDNLKREGTPYTRINSATALTAATLADGDHAKYQAVIVSGANGTATGGVPAGFTPAEFDLLHAYELKFGIRQLDVNAFPGPVLGLNFASTTGTLDGMAASLTAVGQAQFPSLKGPVPFEDLSPTVSESFGETATPCDATTAACNATSFETLVQAPGGASLAGVAQTKDGREELVSTFSANQFQLHNGLLRHEMLSWVTGGVYLGEDRSYLSMDVDDIFLPDDKWNPATHTTPEGTAAGQQDLRMTPADVTRLIAFQNANGIKLNMLFNGTGVGDAQNANGGVDTLFDAFVANKAQFPWVNHTFTHAVLGAPNPGTPPSQATIQSEISQNVQFATTNALPNFDRTALVTGEHSGIGTSNPPVAANPNMAPALTATGITAVGADNSREIGQRQIGSALTLPRYPMNVFYNVSTWADQLNEYNWLYLASSVDPANGNCVNSATTTCFTTPTTQAQFVDREASAVVQHMLGNDPRPHYAHQTNLISDPTNANVANRGDGILFAVIGEVVARYRSYFNTPIVQPGMNALKDELRRQIAWSSTSDAQVSGYIQDGKVNIASTVSRDVPLTGTTAGDVYGGRRSGWRAVTSGTTTLDLEQPLSTVAPTISGQNKVGSTLTGTLGTFTGSPAPTITSRQWQRRTPGAAQWISIPGATGTTYVATTTDQGRELRFVTTAANRRATWGMGLSTAFAIPGPILVPDPTQPGSTTPPGTTSPGGTTPGTTPGKTPVKGSAARPPFTCKVSRGKKLTLACTLRSTTGKPKTARIRAKRGKKIVGTASGRVKHGNRVPILRMKRTTRRLNTSITITVKLANGKARVLKRTMKL